MASGGPAGGQTFEKFDKQIGWLSSGSTPNPFVQIFKIWSPGKAAGGKVYKVKLCF
jgi:hypothetical protein